MLTLSEHRHYIEALVAHNRTDVARDYCRRLPHPISRIWLAEIDQRLKLESLNKVTEAFRLSDGDFLADPFAWRDRATTMSAMNDPFAPESQKRNKDNNPPWITIIKVIAMIAFIMMRTDIYFIFIGIFALLLTYANSRHQ